MHQRHKYCSQSTARLCSRKSPCRCWNKWRCSNILKPRVPHGHWHLHHAWRWHGLGTRTVHSHRIGLHSRWWRCMPSLKLCCIQSLTWILSLGWILCWGLLDVWYPSCCWDKHHSWRRWCCNARGRWRRRHGNVLAAKTRKVTSTL